MLPIWRTLPAISDAIAATNLWTWAVLVLLPCRETELRFYTTKLVNRSAIVCVAINRLPKLDCYLGLITVSRFGNCLGLIHFRPSSNKKNYNFRGLANASQFLGMCKYTIPITKVPKRHKFMEKCIDRLLPLNHYDVPAKKSFKTLKCVFFMQIACSVKRV